jgi:hypothetical protein
MKKPALIIGLIGVVAVGVIVANWYLPRHTSYGNLFDLARNKPSYKTITGYSDETYLYSCSKPIIARKMTVQSLSGPAETYIPINPDEAALYCHSTAAIENEGKIKVLQQPAVTKLLAHYNPKDVTIKALEFKYIQDPGFVDRLLPAYKGKDIGCIIILDTPGEDKVFLEDHQLDTFKEIDYATFAKELSKASAADRKTFYDNLQ